MKGGMFTGNFETHLGELSPSAYIPFNVSTGTTADPIAPMNQHDSRLDMQVPTTPNLMKGGKRSRKNKTKKSPCAMKGGNWFGSVPVFREIASNHDYALGTLATDRHTNQPTVVNSQPISNPANLFESRYLI
jgi:hypothetical protein